MQPGPYQLYPRGVWCGCLHSILERPPPDLLAFVSEAVDRVVDRAIQLCGGAGVTHETPLGRFMNEVRAIHIYDGPAETHRWAIARREVRRAASVT